MPTKRRVLIFLIVLTVMLLLKRAVGQESGQIGWQVCYRDPGIGEQMTRAWVLGILFGVVSGWWLAARRAAAAREGRYFTGDLIQLRLR